MKSIVFVETTMYIQFDVAVICFKTMQPDVEQCHASTEKNTHGRSLHYSAFKSYASSSSWWLWRVDWSAISRLPGYPLDWMYSKVSGSETYSLGCRFSWFVVRRHLESQGLRMLRWEKKGFSTICMYIYIYIWNLWTSSILGWKNPPKEGLFQSKHWSFGFQVHVDM